MFTTGCLGVAAAASLMMLHTSCLWPATLLAGLNFSSVILLLVKVLVLVGRRIGNGSAIRIREELGKIKDTARFADIKNE